MPLTIDPTAAAPKRFLAWRIIRAHSTSTGWAIAILIAVAFAARGVQFGNPVVQVDDQFYLLVGDRLLHGALPYVDIWDRKPIGLFLIYAAIRLLGGTGIVEYQIVATLFVAATAIVIRQAALRIASPSGALGAGVIYILVLGMFGGDGGQSPVFYNLLVALAGWLMMRIVSRVPFGRASYGQAAAAMLLMGCAIQIKYSVVFEGAFFGCVLLHHAWRARISFAALGAAALLWLTLGLAPTIAAWGAYAAMGHGAAFVFANFTSIFNRASDAPNETIGRLAGMIVLTLPIAYIASAGLWPRRGVPMPQPGKFVFGWCIAAIGGVLVFGSYFDHYALPMFVPLTIAAAVVLGQPRSGLRIVAGERELFVPAVVVLALFCTAFTIATIDRNLRVRGRGEQVWAMAAYLKPRLTDCLFVYDGEPILYHLTGSCLPTRWPFSDHLNNKREDGAVGVDALAETQRIMATWPRFVVSNERPETKINLRTWTYMAGILAREYRPVRGWKVGTRYNVLYERLPDR